MGRNLGGDILMKGSGRTESKTDQESSNAVLDTVMQIE